MFNSLTADFARGLSAPYMGTLGALFAGILMACSIAPWDLAWTVFIAPLLMYLCVFQAGPRRALWLGLVFGVANFGLSVSWVFVSIYEHGNASVALAGTLTALFVVGLALVLPATQMLFFRLLSSKSNVIVFALVWVLWEWLSTWIFTGFPWLLIGYAVIDSPYAGYAPIGGVLLVSLMALLTISIFWHAWSERQYYLFIIVIAIPMVGFGLARISWVEPAGEPLEVALVQANVPQNEKWDPTKKRLFFDLYRKLSKPHWAKDIIVWSENSITVPLPQAGVWINQLEVMGKRNKTTLITGIINYETKADGAITYNNTAIAIGAGNGIYVKRKLVPFGEYLPYESILGEVVNFFNLPFPNMSSGPDIDNTITAGTTRIAMAICYEIVFPELVRSSGQNPELLLTISNDSWFGSSSGPLQHLQIARMRALEMGRYLMRSTSNGVTAIVDDRGRVKEQLPRFKVAVLVGEVQPLKGKTLFAIFGFKPWIVIILMAIIAWFTISWQNRISRQTK